MEKKKKRKKKRHGRRRITPMQSLLQGLFLGFCICLLVFSLWKLASIFMGYHSGEKEYDDLRQYVLSEPADAEIQLLLIIPKRTQKTKEMPLHPLHKEWSGSTLPP